MFILEEYGSVVFKPPLVEKPPVTTAFVGNIHERCSNDLIRALLQECGNVVSWKRIQGSNGKYQAFGFCEFDHPESTLRALRILHDWPLGEKKLVLKVDDKTREMLRGHVEKKRQAAGKPSLNLEKDQLPVDEDLIKDDDRYKKAIEELIKHQGADLARVEGKLFFHLIIKIKMKINIGYFSEGEIAPKSPTLHGKGGV